MFKEIMENWNYSFWIYGYDAGNATADFIPIQSTGTLPAGLGFTMKGVNGTDLTDAGDGGWSTTPGTLNDIGFLWNHIRSLLKLNKFWNIMTYFM